MDKKISREQEQAAEASPLGLHIEPPPNSLAPYFVEEVRKQLEKEFGAEEVHGAGLRVSTTLDLDLQTVANRAVLADTAARARDLDEAQAEQARQRAEELVRTRTDKREIAEAQAELMRAIAQLKAIERLRKTR